MDNKFPRNTLENLRELIRELSLLIKSLLICNFFEMSFSFISRLYEIQSEKSIL